MSQPLNLNRGYLSAFWGPNKNYLSLFLEMTLKYYDIEDSLSKQSHVNGRPGQCEVKQVWRIYLVRTTGFLAGIRRRQEKEKQKTLLPLVVEGWKEGKGVGEEKTKLYGLTA